MTDILERMEKLAKKHPATIIRLGVWHGHDSGMLWIAEFHRDSELYSGRGASPGEAYCDMRRAMVMTDNPA